MLQTRDSFCVCLASSTFLYVVQSVNEIFVCSELFPTLVLKMRKYAALIRSCEENCLVRIQYLLKAASAVVTNLRSDNTVEDFCLSWEEVKELYSITQIIINSSITAHLSNKSSEIKVKKRQRQA